MAPKRALPVDASSSSTKKQYTPRTYSDMLMQDGVCVLPIFETQAEINHWAGKIRNVKWPEFKEEAEAPFVMGGFGAFGHASSFHDPLIKHLRYTVKHKVAREVFADYSPNLNLEAMFDRLSERHKNFGTINAESWHQDVFVHKNDKLFGGWLNLDTTESQVFICVTGTQDVKLTDKSGFALVTDVNMLKRYGQHEKQISVPPGHAILIQQGLIHRVNPKLPSANSSFRLYHGFRLTTDDQPLFPNQKKVISTLGVPNLPSGQMPPMYSPVHIMYRKNLPKLKSFCSKLHTDFLCDHTFANGELKGKTIDVPGKSRIAFALKGRLDEETLEMYEYDQVDIDVLTPQPILSFINGTNGI